MIFGKCGGEALTKGLKINEFAENFDLLIAAAFYRDDVFYDFYDVFGNEGGSDGARVV